MAQIKKYTSTETLSTPSMANMRVSNPVPEAIQGLGAQISNVAEHFQQQQETKENFKTEDGYRKLQMNLGQEAQTQAEQMAEDGSGFHDAFMKKTYTPAREQFLASVPQRLRDKYETILGDDGSDTTAWSIKAATAEKDKLYSWYDNQLNVGQEELQAAINMDPSGYDTILKQGIDQIDASGLPPTKKEEQRQKWTKLAQMAHLDRMLTSQPESILKDLGADPSMLSPTTQFNMLKQSVTYQESRGNPNAISPKGAIGLMQVMPQTAMEISRELGDGKVTAGMTDNQIREVVSNPKLNEQYGDYYLKKMLRTYGKHGIEGALIGYNAGGKRVEEWAKAGYDNSVLPKETQKYVTEVMGRLPYGAQSEKFPGKAPKGDPASVRFTWDGRKDLDGQGDESKLDQDMVGRVKTAFAGLGIDNVKINSGFRSEAENTRVGGAKGSQHKHGNAVDIDVSGYSIAERTKIIQALSSSGITGLGIGSNIIHADTGGRRAWGYASSAGGGDVPKWAQGAIEQHLANTAQAPSRVGVGGRYAGLPYDVRRKYIAAADQQLTQQQTLANKATAVQTVELKTAMRNELATLQTTGQSTNLVDDTAVSTVLGEDDYIKWIAERERATKTYNARDGIAEMSLGEMDSRLQEYTPDPGSETFADDQKVQAAVQKEIDRVTKLRTDNPTAAAMLYPDVSAQWAKVDGVENAPPEAVQEFVRLNLERQKEFGIKPGSEQPVPRPWAVAIGQQISKIPDLQGKNKDDVNAAIIVMYDSLQKTFGDYTDEVIINALKEYKGVGTNTATLLTGLMQGIQAGGDPMGRMRAKQDKALDMDQVEEATGGGFWDSMGELFTGKPSPVSERYAAKPVAGGDQLATPPEANPENILRAQTLIDNLGEDMTPEQEAGLVRRFGQGVVDAAKRKATGIE